MDRPDGESLSGRRLQNMIRMIRRIPAHNKPPTFESGSQLPDAASMEQFCGRIKGRFCLLSNPIARNRTEPPRDLQLHWGTALAVCETKE
jgi:hypothetical protein